MKLIIDIPDEDYKFIKEVQFYHSGRRSGKTIERNVINAIKNGVPYEPEGDLISRKALKEYSYGREDTYGDIKQVVDVEDIDNAPTIAEYIKGKELP